MHRSCITQTLSGGSLHNVANWYIRCEWSLGVQ